MKSFWNSIFVAFCVALFAAVPMAAAADVPGDGFSSEDPCGFVMGTSRTYVGGGPGTGYSMGQLLADYVSDADQLCFDESGYAYSDAKREALLYHSRHGYIDFTWSSNAFNNPNVDTVTGYWSGYAQFKVNPGTASNEQWLWLDWTCKDVDGAAGCTEADYASKRPRTDMETGLVSGYAWNDAVGFVRLDGLTMELPPRQVQVFVDVLAVDSENGPEDVDITNAPLADGAQYWDVRVQFWDVTDGVFLDESDISSLNLAVEETADSQVYFNQLDKEGEAVRLSVENEALEGCTSDDAPSGYCAQLEEDGSTGFHTYVYASAPTSNMLGLSSDGEHVDTPADRDGCNWIYEDYWSVYGSSQLDCPEGSGEYYDKMEVFYDRSTGRNQLAIEHVSFEVEFASSTEMNIYEYDNGEGGSRLYEDGGSYYYEPDASEEELSFRPRFRAEELVMYYDGQEYTESISSDLDAEMELRFTGTALAMSDELAYYDHDTSGEFWVFYQVDAVSDSGNSPRPDYETFLLLDTADPPDGEVGFSESGKRLNARTLSATSTTDQSFAEQFAVAYEVKSPCESAQTPGTGGAIAWLWRVAEAFTIPACEDNELSHPTAEVTICDQSVHDPYGGNESCYLAAYLPVLDFHKDPEDMLVIGAIHSGIDVSGYFSDNLDDYVSVLGEASTIALRNKMYAQIARYTLGQSASGGRVNDDMEPYSDSGLVELMNGRLLYAEGDVTLDGSTNFSDKTLVVVGGDVTINGNVTGGKLGLIVLKKNGAGGHVYLDPSVTDLHTNIFLDGSLFSKSGTVNENGVPQWGSSEERLETLLHQLYIKGSLISKNTVKGSESTNDDGVYELANGTTTPSYAVALEYDLNRLRQYRLCYGVTDEGTPDTSVEEECDEGEELSQYLDEDEAAVYNPVVIEHDPAGDLPIFVVESGLFN